MIIKLMRYGTLFFGKESLVFSHKEVDTHSTLSGFSMEIFLKRVYMKNILIIGRWSINAFLWYIRANVRDLSKGISDIMVNTQAFYKTPEA